MINKTITQNSLINSNDLFIILNNALNNKLNIEISINGEYYNINKDLTKYIYNAFKTNYNNTITLKINGEIKVLNGVLIK